jgi:hypothetical protein
MSLLIPWVLLTVLQESRGAILGPSAPQAEIFALIDRFDGTDTSRLPFVKVATGLWRQRGSSGEPEVHYRHGFLLSDNDGRFSVRFLDLTEATLTASRMATSEPSRVGFERISLTDHVQEVAKLLDLIARDANEPRYYMTPNEPMDPRGMALVLARDLARRHAWEDVNRIWNALGDIPKAREELGDGLRNRWHLLFGDPTVSRETLVNQVALWLDAFPNSYYRPWIETLRGGLVAQLKDEKAASRESRPTNEGVGAAIAALVKQLRDDTLPVDSEQHIFSGHFLDIAAPSGARSGVALVKFGFEAVPQLLEVVDDPSPSRCVWYSSRHGGGFRVFTIGDLARIVLQEIAGLVFYGEPKELRQAWTAWWADASVKGEETALAERVVKGDATSCSVAARFLERYPHRVADVMTACKKAVNRAYKTQFVEIVATSRDPSVEPFLIERLTSGPYIEPRVAAAQALLDRGDDRGVRHFIELWRRAEPLPEERQPDVPEAVADWDHELAVQGGVSASVKLLLTSGSTDALTAIEEGLRAKPPNIRSAVASQLRSLTLDDVLRRVPDDRKRDTQARIEELMMSFLTDSSRSKGMWGFTFQGSFVSLTDPRTADLTACAIVNLWPDRYRFDPMQPEAARDRQIAEILAAWKATRPASRPREGDRK